MGFLMAAHHVYSPQSCWKSWSPWFGEPEELESYYLIDPDDYFIIKTSDAQLEDWEKRMGLRVDSPEARLLSFSDGRGLRYVKLAREYRGCYLLSIQHVDPFEYDTEKEASHAAAPQVERLTPDEEGWYDTVEFILLLLVTVLLFPVCATIWVRWRSKPFRFPLLMSLVATVIYADVSWLIAVLSIVIRGAYGFDTPFFPLIFGWFFLSLLGGIATLAIHGCLWLWRKISRDEKREAGDEPSVE